LREARKFYDDAAKERQRASGGDHTKGAVMENVPQPDVGTARDQAGKAVGVSGKLIDQVAEAVGRPGRSTTSR